MHQFGHSGLKGVTHLCLGSNLTNEVCNLFDVIHIVADMKRSYVVAVGNGGNGRGRWIIPYVRGRCDVR